MYHEERSWGIFLFRVVEIVFTINIVILDLFVFHNFLSPATSPIATTAKLPSPTPTAEVTVNQTSPTTVINQITGAKELFIPIGQGSTTGTEWTDIIGAQVNIDSTKYTSVKQVVFEASVESPNNQIISVRLYDKSDNHPVWYSEMSTNSTNQFVTSQPIQLDSGNKTYQVQIKTQLGYTAILDQARVHITLH